MKKLISTIFLLLILNISTTASIFDILDVNENNSTSKIETTAALLWMPRAESSFENIINELERNPNLKITIALSEAIENQDFKKLKKFSTEGRIEIIMRLTNNPLIGLFYYPKNIAPLKENLGELQYSGNNPFFFAQRLTDARNTFIENLAAFPAGFANSPGDIFPDYVPLAKSIELRWLASGPLISTSTYDILNCEGINIVPFELFKSSEMFILKENALNFIVYDETLSLQTEETENDLLLDFLDLNTENQYLTVSEAINVAISTPISRTSLPLMTLPWTKDYSLWTSDRHQRGLLTGLEKTREEILRFMGLNQNKTKRIRRLLNAFYEIESSGQLLQILENQEKKSNKIELNLQNKFAKIYREMGKSLPNWLFKSFKELSSENNIATVQISSGTNFINFKNSFIPTVETTAKNETETISSATFRIAEMDIHWDDTEIEFYLKPELINDEEYEEINFENIEIDIYIDINNRLRAGRRRPLRGNKINILPQDAWEYSISINSEETTINYAAMSGIKKLSSVETIKENGGFKIILPRKTLRGNPLRWGYSAIIFSDKSTKEFTDKLSSDKQKGYLSSIRPGRK
jgi:C-terminal binding-module, SLH-like, of glucodextranase